MATSALIAVPSLDEPHRLVRSGRASLPDSAARVIHEACAEAASRPDTERASRHGPGEGKAKMAPVAKEAILLCCAGATTAGLLVYETVQSEATLGRSRGGRGSPA